VHNNEGIIEVDFVFLP